MWDLLPLKKQNQTKLEDDNGNELFKWVNFITYSLWNNLNSKNVLNLFVKQIFGIFNNNVYNYYLLLPT